MTTPLPVWRRNFARRQSDVIDLVPVLPHAQNTVTIGARWSTGHAIVRDPVTGAYEERNSPMETETELAVQRALLSTPKGNRLRYWLGVPALLLVTWAGCRMAGL